MNKETVEKISALHNGEVDGIKHSFSEIAIELGISKDVAQKVHKKISGTVARTNKLPSPWTLSGNVAVVGDTHVPDVRWDLCAKVSEYSKQHDVKVLCMVGDLGNFDQFSKYKSLMKDPEFSSELEQCGNLLRYWLETFDTIYWCRGNHDSRSIEYTDGKLNMDLLADMMVPGKDRDRVKTSMYNGMWLKTIKGKYLLAHQKEYSKGKLVVAQRLCEMYQCHIVTHHQHHTAVGQDRTGRYMIADNGCLVDPKKVAYKRLNYSTSNEFNLGFALIVGGMYLPYSEGSTWSWLR